jgi:CBS-domain-containing membrane protein
VIRLEPRTETSEAAAMRVDLVMNRNVMTIGIDATCDEALSQMLRWNVRHLPVLMRAGTSGAS